MQNMTGYHQSCQCTTKHYKIKCASHDCGCVKVLKFKLQLKLGMFKVLLDNIYVFDNLNS